MSTKQNEVAGVGGTFVTIDDDRCCGSRAKRGFAVAAVAAVVVVAGDADDFADDVDDALGFV